MAVSEERWNRAQRWELAFWQSKERRAGWRRLAYPLARPLLALVGDRRVTGDDDNVWWRRAFDGYRFLPRDLGDCIELGCGPYTNTRLVLKNRSARRIVCSDPLAAEYLHFEDRWLATAVRKGRVEVDAHPIEKLPFPARSFDTVVLINVLDHVRDLHECMRLAIGLLRPGGWFVFGQDLAHPDAELPEYEWHAEGHPHRVSLEEVRPHLVAIQARYERRLPPRDPRLHEAALAYAGIAR